MLHDRIAPPLRNAATAPASEASPPYPPPQAGGLFPEGGPSPLAREVPAPAAGPLDTPAWRRLTMMLPAPAGAAPPQRPRRRETLIFPVVTLDRSRPAGPPS